MIYPFDFHIHSTFCDGKDSPEDIIKVAIDKGLEAIGFSSHSYNPFDDGNYMNEKDTDICQVFVKNISFFSHCFRV